MARNAKLRLIKRICRIFEEYLWVTLLSYLGSSIVDIFAVSLIFRKGQL